MRAERERETSVSCSRICAWTMKIECFRQTWTGRSEISIHWASDGANNILFQTLFPSRDIIIKIVRENFIGQLIILFFEGKKSQASSQIIASTDRKIVLIFPALSTRPSPRFREWTSWPQTEIYGDVTIVRKFWICMNVSETTSKTLLVRTRFVLMSSWSPRLNLSSMCRLTASTRPRMMARNEGLWGNTWKINMICGIYQLVQLIASDILQKWRVQ